MKNIISLNTRSGSAFELTVEAYSGMIHLTTAINGTEYTMLRLPQELKQWPINGTLRMIANAGSDFGGQLIAELDDDSAERLDAILEEAAQRVDEAREYDEIPTAQLPEEYESDAGEAHQDEDDDFWRNFFDD